MENIKNILNKKEPEKSPAYSWQELALKVIDELNVPSFKRNSVFKACKDNSREFIERCMNDTKELVEEGEQWKYFFKLISNKNKKNPE